MMYKIRETCVKCGVCLPECPVNAIIEKEDQFIILNEKCIKCGRCEAICPVNVIYKK